MADDGRLYFDDVKVGQEWTTPGRTVTEADIVHFAGISGDFNPLHIDAEFAKKTPFGQRIAHGLLGLSLSTGLRNNHVHMATLAFLGIVEWNFKGPIFIGDTVRLVLKVEELRPSKSKPKVGIILWSNRLVNQKGEVVQEGKHHTMVERRGA